VSPGEVIRHLLDNPEPFRNIDWQPAPTAAEEWADVDVWTPCWPEGTTLEDAVLHLWGES
jgi:hypothetical protein